MFPIVEHRRTIDPLVMDPESNNLDNKGINPIKDHGRKKEDKHLSKVTSLRFKMSIEKIVSKVPATTTGKDTSKPIDLNNKTAKEKDKDRADITDRRDKDRFQRKERSPKVHFHLAPNPPPQSS